MRKISTNPSTHEKLVDIRAQLDLLTKPANAYHEYYRVTSERGFTKITLPKKRG